MKKWTIIISILISLPLYSSEKIDSLIIELGRSENNIQKVDILNEIAYEYSTKNPVKAQKYLNEAMKLANEIGYVRGQAANYYLVGTILRYQGKYEASMENYCKSIRLYEEIPDSVQIAHSYNYIGQIYLNQGMYDKAFEYYRKAYRIYEIYGNKEGLCFMTINIGTLFYETDNYDSAMYYGLRSMEAAKKDNDTERLAIAFNNLACIASVRNELEQAKEYYLTAYNKFLELENYDGITLALLNIGGIYVYEENSDSALFYLNKCYRLAKEKNIVINLERVTKFLADIYIDKEEYIQACELLILNNQLRDSLYHNNIKDAISELEIKHVYEKENEQQSLKLEIEEKKNKLQKIILYGSSFLFIIIIGFAYLLHKNKLKQLQLNKQKLLLEKKILKDELKYKNNELMNFALQIVQRNDFIIDLRKKVKKLSDRLKNEQDIKELDNIAMFINYNLDLGKAKKEFYKNVILLNEAFFHKLKQKFPNLTENEERLALLLRLNFSSKKIASLLNLSTHAVEMGRYRLRKKFELASGDSLPEFFNNI